MEQILLHLTGDYLLQNDWMAKNKRQPGNIGFIACFIHCVVYSLPFLFIADLKQVCAIFLAHLLIDRSGAAEWYMKNFGLKGFLKNMAPWSVILVDNIFHLITNYLILL